MNKKLQNFWYYHKVKVIVLLFIIFSVIVIIMFTKKNTEPDVSIAYVTDGRKVSEETENKMSRELLPVIEDATGDKKKSLALVPLYAVQIDLEFTSEGSQLVLMDGHTLDKYKSTGALEQVDEYLNKYNIDVSKNPEVKAIVEDGVDEHFYAIPVKDVDYMLNAGFPGDNYYLTVRQEYKDSKAAKTKSKNAHAIMDLILGFNK